MSIEYDLLNLKAAFTLVHLQTSWISRAYSQVECVPIPLIVPQAGLHLPPLHPSSILAVQFWLLDAARHC